MALIVAAVLLFRTVAFPPDGTQLQTEQLEAPSADSFAEMTREFAAAVTRIEQGAFLRRIEDISNQAGLANASEAIAFVESDLERRKNAVEQASYDGHYFSSLLIMSAEMGLLGDFRREAELLIRFWQDFSDHVSDQAVDDVMAVVNADIAAIGTEFQRFVDSGKYEVVITGQSAANVCLKPELRSEMQWPNYADFWPFSLVLRNDFRSLRRADDDVSRAKWNRLFTKHTPSTPLGYLGALLFDDSGRDAKPRQWTAEERDALMAMKLSVLRHYFRKPPRSEADNSALRMLEFDVVGALTIAVYNEEVSGDQLAAALPILRMIAHESPVAEVRASATDLLSIVNARRVEDDSGQDSNGRGP
jgi:hypothetical protein